MGRSRIQTVQDPVHLFQFLHEIRLCVEPAGSIYNQHVGASGLARLIGVVCNSSRVAPELVAYYIYANLLDLNEDGKIDMISFLDPQGRGIAVAVDRASDGDMDHIHVFQDVTGDGKLDMDDTRLIEREALKLFRQEGLEEGQLKRFVEDGAYG